MAMDYADLRRTLQSISQELTCSVCFSLFTDAHSLPCMHIFCKSCIDRCLTLRPNCPLCNAPFNRRQLHPCGIVHILVPILRMLHKEISSFADIPCLSQDDEPENGKNLPSIYKPLHSVNHHKKSRIETESRNRTEINQLNPRPNDTAIIMGLSRPKPMTNISNVAVSTSSRVFDCPEDGPTFATPLRPENVDQTNLTPNSATPTLRGIFRTLSTPKRNKPKTPRPETRVYTEVWSPIVTAGTVSYLQRCNVCYDADERPILTCRKCSMSVHFGCYGVPCNDSSANNWMCAPCIAGLLSTPSCCLCPNTDDKAMRSCTNGEWAHVSCALWAPQPTFSETEHGNGGMISNVEKTDPESNKLRCVICHNIGFCLQCEYGNCTVAFHIPCAARSTFKLELRQMNEKIYFHQFCSDHSRFSDQVATDNTATVRRPRCSSSSAPPASKRHSHIAVSPSHSRHQGHFVLLLTGITLDVGLQSLLSSNTNASLSMTLSDSVTHVITRCHISGIQKGRAKSRTVKYMYGVARGIWCVSQTWIHDWIKLGHPPDEQKYEVVGDYAAIGAPRRSRIRIQQKNMPLFNNVNFVIFGPFGNHLGLEIELADIIVAAGGRVVKALPDAAPTVPTVLIKEDCESDAHAAEIQMDKGARCQCESFGIPIYNVQRIFDLLSFFTSPIIN